MIRSRGIFLGEPCLEGIQQKWQAIEYNIPKYSIRRSIGWAGSQEQKLWLESLGLRINHVIFGTSTYNFEIQHNIGGVRGGRSPNPIYLVEDAGLSVVDQDTREKNYGETYPQSLELYYVITKDTNFLPLGNLFWK